MSNKGGVDYSQHHIEIDLRNQKTNIMIKEPIDLLKSELAKLEKAINKSTVATYNQVKKNLDPYIKKYQQAIAVLEHVEVIPPSQPKKSICDNCHQLGSEYCAQSCTEKDIPQGCLFDDDIFNPEQ